jgi:Domain of unknown function (DUF5069)
MNIPPTDLTTRPPRSARVRLGGYALLPRMLDKGRAELLGKNGDYRFGCPLDQHLLKFIDLDADALKAELATGKGDGEILEWIEANAKQKREAWEIIQWSAWREQVVPSDVEMREYFTGLQKAAGPNRQDIASWSDLLDLDDYVSFGGKA